MSSVGAPVSVPERRDDVTVSCEMDELINEQKRICQAEIETMPYLVRGLNDGLHECRYQFKEERWNCTGSGEPSWNGPTLNEGSFIFLFHFVCTS